MINAATLGNIAVVRELLDRGADIHAKNDQALRDAASGEHLDVIQELLNYGADINRIPLRIRGKYLHLAPKIINSQDYFRLELIVTEFREFPDKYMIFTGSRSWILFK